MEKDISTSSSQSIKDQSKTQRVIVMTGVTSGIGVHALQHIATLPNTKIIVGAREVEQALPPGVEVLPLDLSSLDSVRGFANTVIQQLGDTHIDILVMNAGIQGGSNERRSKDGFELTFAVNHLGHYLLSRLLLPHMADRGRMMMTTSETHDPAVSPMGVKTFELEEWAHPTKSVGGLRAYAASKLCIMMTCLSLSKLDEVKSRNIDVIAFSPGLTGGTSLGRDSSAFARIFVTILMHTVFRVVGIFRPEFVISTPEKSGAGLAKVALGEVTPPEGQIYINLVKGEPKFSNPSKLAQDEGLQDELWRESAAMVGLK